MNDGMIQKEKNSIESSSSQQTKVAEMLLFIEKSSKLTIFIFLKKSSLYSRISEDTGVERVYENYQ